MCLEDEDGCYVCCLLCSVLFGLGWLVLGKREFVFIFGVGVVESFVCVFCGWVFSGEVVVFFSGGFLFF